MSKDSLTVQEILNLAANKTGDRFVTEEALALTPEGEVVSDGHVDARYVLTGPGGSLPLPLAQRLGLDKPKPAPIVAKPVVVAPPKMVPPAENKAVKPAQVENK